MKFSIIVPHYDSTINDFMFIRGMTSLKNQIIDKNQYEVIVIHDGPVTRKIPSIYETMSNCKVLVTEERKNDWGHSSRDLGIKIGVGDYCLFFNPDNILYPNALEVIANKIDEESYIPNDIILYPILMRGMESDGTMYWRNRNDMSKFTIFTGLPPIKNNIDCMQLVMKRENWNKKNGWYDKSEESDGNMYPALVSEYKARCCNQILGEHW